MGGIARDSKLATRSLWSGHRLAASPAGSASAPAFSSFHSHTTDSKKRLEQTSLFFAVVEMGGIEPPCNWNDWNGSTVLA